MALTRKLLAALGIEEDKIGEIITAHAETVDALKNERDQYKADSERLEAVQAELDALKNDGGYKERYEQEHADFEAYKTEVQAEKTLAAKKAAYEEICKDAGLSERGVAKAMKYADWDSVELDDKGKVKSAATHIKSLKEEWPEHIVTESTKGAETATPPANTGGTTMTIEQIDAIEDTAERQKAMLENHELFGF